MSNHMDEIKSQLKTINGRNFIKRFGEKVQFIVENDTFTKQYGEKGSVNCSRRKKKEENDDEEEN